MSLVGPPSLAICLTQLVQSSEDCQRGGHLSTGLGFLLLLGAFSLLCLGNTKDLAVKPCGNALGGLQWDTESMKLSGGVC